MWGLSLAYDMTNEGNRVFYTLLSSWLIFLQISMVAKGQGVVIG